MTHITVQIIHAFTDQGQGGNTAGVVLHAGHLTQEQKQRVAAQVGYSETAFVSPSQVADFKLEFFTPRRQIPHCGHATIATFNYLVQQGLLDRVESSKETIDGRREIRIAGDRAFMEQLPPRYTPIDVPGVLASLGLDAARLLEGAQPVVANTGNGFAIVPLRDEAAVASLRPDFAAIEQISAAYNLIGYYVFSLQTRLPGRQAAARMFAPLFGIREESATGTAAGPLAGYLHDYLGLGQAPVRGQARMVIEQGRLMEPASPSELVVELDLADGKIEKVWVGGKATVIRQIDVEL
jgi:PhzF family phenazine biosynthesis protein